MSDDLDRRLAALREAAELASGRLDEDGVARARAVVAKAGARLGLGIERTVVALAGPTGAGKSLLFNTLAGTELAAVGRRRPTTSEGQAAIWGDPADPLLDWLEIRRRHRLDGSPGDPLDGHLDGLVLLDLPDFDSVEDTHRLEVDRVVALADLVVWVVEPQKYADAVLHTRYLRPLRTHGAATAVVLNQADLLEPAEIASVTHDAARLLAEDGLEGVPLLALSALTGEGVDELRRLLATRVAARDAAVARLSADVAACAAVLRGSCGEEASHGVGAAARTKLVAALSAAAGVPRVLDAVEDAHGHRGALRTGWPLVRWVRRFRPDPLRRLRLGLRESGGRTSLPRATEVQEAQVATAARALADEASSGMPTPWPTLVRVAATADEGAVADRLDRAVGEVDLDPRPPRWWRLVSSLQLLLAAVAAVGLVWLAVLAVAGFLRVEDVVPLPEVGGVPVPTWLVIAGIGGGIAFATLSRLLNGVGARRRRRAAERALRPAIEAVAVELVVAPVERELEVYTRLCRALELAAGPAPGRRGGFVKR